MPKVSIVTPVFNACEHLEAAFRCLTSQTFSDWEWVVVDDGSTDGSGRMLDDFASRDTRVRVFHQSNSGSAKMPRDRAVHHATGQFLLMLDADDTIDEYYLETMLQKQQETDADIVYPTMESVSDGNVTSILPEASIRKDRVYRGRDLIVMTLPYWRIGCNGGLYRPHVWVNRSYPAYDKTIYMFSDELDERLYLLEADRVAFSSARYSYNIHGNSLTNRVSPKRFGQLNTDLELRSFILETFGCDSIEYELMQRKLFIDLRQCMMLYARNHTLLAPHRTELEQLMSQCYMQAKGARLSLMENMLFMNMRSFRATLMLMRLRHRDHGTSL